MIAASPPSDGNEHGSSTTFPAYRVTSRPTAAAAIPAAASAPARPPAAVASYGNAHGAASAIPRATSAPAAPTESPAAGKAHYWSHYRPADHPEAEADATPREHSPHHHHHMHRSQPRTYHAGPRIYTCRAFGCVETSPSLEGIKLHSETCTLFLCPMKHRNGCLKNGTRPEIEQHVLTGELCPWTPPPPMFKCLAFKCNDHFPTLYRMRNHSNNCNKYLCPKTRRNGCAMEGTRDRIEAHVHAGVCFTAAGIVIPPPGTKFSSPSESAASVPPKERKTMAPSPPPRSRPTEHAPSSRARTLEEPVPAKKEPAKPSRLGFMIQYDLTKQWGDYEETDEGSD